METEGIADACAARKIPMLSLRVISDTTAAALSPASPEMFV
jgi:nucleoside phosphorylase